MSEKSLKRPGVVLLGGAHGSLAVARRLGRRGVPVAFFAPPHSGVALSRYVSPVVRWGGVAEAAPVDRLIGEAQAHQLEGWLLLPGDDFGVQLIAESRERLSQHFLLQTLDWAALAPLNDKGLLTGFAGRLGVDTPAEHPATADPAALQYPVVIKPSFTKAGNALTRAKAWRCDDAEEFAAKQAEAMRLAGPEGFVVQQLIPGEGDVQYSYAAFWQDGREVAQMTALRLRQFPLEFGVSPFVVQQPLPRATEEARQLLSAVNYHGLVEVEFKLDRRDDRLKLLDVNTRIWAWLGLGERCGVDFAGLAYAAATGVTLPPSAARRARGGTAWRRQVPAVLSLLQDLRRHGRPGVAGWRSVLAPAQGAVFAADDPLPALAELPLKVAEKLGRRR